MVMAKERYDATVYAVLTDNAYNMQYMGARCQLLGLLYSTCNAHSANLLAGDIVKKSQNSKIMDKIMTVQRDFRRTGLEDRLLKSGGHKPALSCSTRWTMQRNAAESFLKKLSAMKTVTAACDVEAETDKDAIRPKSNVSSILFNQQFITAVKTLVNILNPVAELANFCQKSTASARQANCGIL